MHLGRTTFQTTLRITLAGQWPVALKTDSLKRRSERGCQPYLLNRAELAEGSQAWAIGRPASRQCPLRADAVEKVGLALGVSV